MSQQPPAPAFTAGPAAIIRWQHDGAGIRGDDPRVLARDAVCLLDVPVHKTGSSFTKPVDPLMGEAIEAWQKIRPAQPRMLDHKTAERADFLFAFRARRVARHYINNAVIPMLCKKAGVPDADVRGRITSHRARSTIASQLYNAKEHGINVQEVARQDAGCLNSQELPPRR